MVIPLGDELIQRYLNGRHINIMKRKQITFIMCLKDAAIFHELEEINVK